MIVGTDLLLVDRVDVVVFVNRLRGPGKPLFTCFHWTFPVYCNQLKLNPFLIKERPNGKKPMTKAQMVAYFADKYELS